eukprot:3986156-Pleurochrysis_carterae.AAC.1
MVGAAAGGPAASPAPWAVSMPWMRAEDASRTRATAPAGCWLVRAPGVAALAHCLQPPESRCMHDLKS